MAHLWTGNFMKLWLKIGQKMNYTNLLILVAVVYSSYMGLLKSGAEATNWNIQKVLQSAFQILHDSPARQEDYESVTGSKKSPLFFCATRFVFCWHAENIRYRPISCIAFVNIFWRTVEKETIILHSIWLSTVQKCKQDCIE